MNTWLACAYFYSHRNQESIETLRTLLKALENPQLSKSLRGTITINLTFGEDNE